MSLDKTHILWGTGQTVDALPDGVDSQKFQKPYNKSLYKYVRVEPLLKSLGICRNSLVIKKRQRRDVKGIVKDRGYLGNVEESEDRSLGRSRNKKGEET